MFTALAVIRLIIQGVRVLRATVRIVARAVLIVFASTLCSTVGSNYALSDSISLGSGAGLLEACDAKNLSTSRNFPAFNYCLGFIMGVADSFSCEEPIMSGFRWQPIEDGNAEQFRKVVVKFLNEHPEHLHLRSGSLVAAALSEAFPCP